MWVPEMKLTSLVAANIFICWASFYKPQSEVFCFLLFCFLFWDGVLLCTCLACYLLYVAYAGLKLMVTFLLEPPGAWFTGTLTTPSLPEIELIIKFLTNGPNWALLPKTVSVHIPEELGAPRVQGSNLLTHKPPPKILLGTEPRDLYMLKTCSITAFDCDFKWCWAVSLVRARM